MSPLLLEMAKLGGSIAAIFFVYWMVKRMGLGGDVRIRDEAHARQLADEAICGFEAVNVVIDKAGIAALLKDASGRHMLVRRHGVQFAGRLLDHHSESRLDQNFLTIGTGEKTFGKVTLNLGPDAQLWAAGLRRIST
jgi:hypothetical protein